MLAGTYVSSDPQGLVLQVSPVKQCQPFVMSSSNIGPTCEQGYSAAEWPAVNLVQVLTCHQAMWDLKVN